MNARKISVAPLEPHSVIVPKNGQIKTTKRVKTVKEPNVSHQDLENIRDLVMPIKPSPKQQLELQEVKEDTLPILPPITAAAASTPTIGVVSTDLKSSPNKQRTIKVMQNEGTVEQFEADVEIGSVYRRIDGHVEETWNEERFIRQIILFTTICVLCCCCGVLLILIGFAQSEAFQNIEPNVGVVCVGFLLQLPMGYWFYRKCYPTQEEIETRERLRKNRRYRSKAMKKDDIKYIEDTNEEDRRFHDQEKLEMKRKYNFREQLKHKNPLGYPTPGVTRHRWDDS
jgi:hypothetical protein